MSEVSIYSQNDDSIPLNSFLLNSSTIISDVIALIGPNNHKICLKTKYDLSIAFNDSIAQSWVFDILTISSPYKTNLYSVLRRVKSSSYIEICIDIQLLKIYTFQHWNERILDDQSSRRDKLFSNHSENINKMLGDMLISSYLMPGACFAVEILDHIMVYECSKIYFDSSPCNEDDDFMALEICYPTSNITFRSIEPIKSLSSPSILSSHSNSSWTIGNQSTMRFFQLSYDKVKTILNGIRSHHHRYYWHGPRTMIVMGPQGSGKSYLLSSIENVLFSQDKNQDREQDQEFRILSFSISSYRDQNNTLRSTVSSGITYDINHILRLILDIIELFDVNAHSVDYKLVQSFDQTQLEHFFQSKTTVIIIDDMDIIFHQYLDSKDMNTSDNTFNQNFISKIAYILHQLSTIISMESTSQYSLLLISSTSLSSSQLPNHNTIYPTFDAIIKIPKPSYNDRILLIQQFMVDIFPITVQFQSIDNPKQKDYIKTDRWIWYEKMAGLTGGYLPYDLKMFVTRAWNYYQGILKSSNRSSDSSNNMNNNHNSSINDSINDNSNSIHSSTNKLFLWEYILKTYNMTPPRLLIDMKNSENDGVLNIGNNISRVLSWNDFCGYDDIKTKLQVIIKRIHSNSSNINDSNDSNDDNITTNLFRNKLSKSDMNTGNVKGIVLYGDSGTGKSFLASIIAAEAKMNFVSIQSTEILSQYYSESEAKIRKLFQSARAAAPCLLFFDEFDAIACKRTMNLSSDGSNNLNARILSTFLNELDGIQAVEAFSSDVLVVVSCQDIHQLDDALIRTGRLQYHFHLHLPTRADIIAMLQRKLCFSSNDDDTLLSEGSIPCDCDVSVEDMADRLLLSSHYPTGASVQGLCNKAIRCVIREYIHSSQNKSESMSTLIEEPSKVSLRHFLSALREKI